MNHLSMSCAVLFLCYSIPAAAVTTIMPEKSSRVSVSTTDVNRIKCGDGVITGVHYSKDKNMIVEVKDSNAYVKFMALKEGEKITYSDRASEVFVTCGGEVYELILIPKKVNAKTVYLSNPIKNKISGNIERFGSLPLEEKIVRFSVAMLTNDADILEPLSVKKFKASQQDWFDYDTKTKIGKVAEFQVEGIGLKVTKFNLITTQDVRFTPTAFLDTRIGENILGVTLDPETVNAGEMATLIVVEKDVNHGR